MLVALEASMSQYPWVVLSESLARGRATKAMTVCRTIPRPFIFIFPAKTDRDAMLLPKFSHLVMAGYFPRDILVVVSSLLSTKTFATAAVEKLGAYGLLSLKKSISSGLQGLSMESKSRLKQTRQPTLSSGTLLARSGGH